MEKELKSGHSHPTLFGRNWLNGRISHALLVSPQKDHRASFSIIFYYIISTTYQKIGDLFYSVFISGLLHSVEWVDTLNEAWIMELTIHTFEWNLWEITFNFLHLFDDNLKRFTLIVRRLTSAEFAFLFMVSNPYVL